MKVQVYEGEFHQIGRRLFYYDLSDLNHRKDQNGNHIPELMFTQRIIWDLFWDVGQKQKEEVKQEETLEQILERIAALEKLIADLQAQRVP